MRLKIKIYISLFLILISVSVGIIAFADTTNDSLTSVDAVILLDQRYSMQNSTASGEASDPDYFRLDAASLFVNMCKIEGSKVAIVPFNNGIIEDDYWSKWIELENEHQRVNLTNSINNYKKVSPNTDIGAALEKAVWLLDESKKAGSKNSPMILLLTDDKIDIYKGEGHIPLEHECLYPIEYVNEENKIIKYSIGDTISDENYTNEVATVVYNTAKEACIDKQYPVYAVPFGNIADEDLRNLAIKTGGSILASFVTAEEMPLVFAQVLGEHIGSKFQTVDSQATSFGSSIHELFIHVPNESIKEINIVIPINKVPKTYALRLYDPNEEVLVKGENSNTNNILVTKTKHFLLYKIINPEPSEWKLQGIIDDGAASFNLLYNYDIELAASLYNNNNQLVSAVTKNDKVIAKAYFVDELNSNAINDEYLYRADNNGFNLQVGEDNLFSVAECTINKNTVAMENQAENLCFATELDIQKLGISKAGTYTAQVSVEGAGILRNAVIDFDVVNNKPQLNDGFDGTDINLTIKDPADVLNFDKPANYSLDLNKVFYDQDNEKLSYKVEYEKGEKSPIAVLIDENNILKVTTEDCNFNEGQGSFTVIATDMPDKDSVTCTFNYNVTSIQNVLSQRYLPVISYSEDGKKEIKKTENNRLEKNQEIEVYLRLFDNKSDSQLNKADTSTDKTITEEIYSLVSEPKLIVSYVRDDETRQEEIYLEYNSEKQAYVGNYIVSNFNSEYNIMSEFKFGDIINKSDIINIKVINTPPQLNEEFSGKDINLTIKDPADGEDINKAALFSLDLSKVFFDEDSDELSYKVEYEKSENSPIAVSIDENNILNVTTEDCNFNEGQGSFTVIATDMPDKDSVTCTFNYNVTSIQNVLSQRYLPVLSFSEDGKKEIKKSENNRLEKNQEIEVYMRLVDSESNSQANKDDASNNKTIAEEIYSLISEPKLIVSYVRDDETRQEEIDLKYDSEKQAYVGNYTVANFNSLYNIVADIKFGDINSKSENLEIRVGNVSPQVDTQAIQSAIDERFVLTQSDSSNKAVGSISFGFEALSFDKGIVSEILRFGTLDPWNIGERKGEYTIDLSKIFNDPDNEELKYTVVVNSIDSAETEKIPVQAIIDDNNVLTLNPINSGECIIKITATDNDNVKADLILNANVYSLRQRSLEWIGIILIALLLLILIIKMLLHVLKSKYPANCTISMTANEAPVSSTFQLGYNKAKHNLYEFYEELEGIAGIPIIEIKNISLQTNTSNSIMIIVKKKPKTCKIVLDSREISKGKAVWYPDMTLSIINESQEQILSWKFSVEYEYTSFDDFSDFDL